MKSNIPTEFFNDLDNLIVFSSLNENPVIKYLKSDLNSIFSTNGEVLNRLINYSESNNLAGDLWVNYLTHLILTDKNIFSLKCEKEMLSKEKSLYHAALHDLRILKKLLEIDTSDLFNLNSREFDLIIKNYNPVNRSNDNIFKELTDLVGNSDKDIISKINQYFYDNGAGLLNQFKAFTWDKDNFLLPVKNPDPIDFEGLIGYEKQKKKLIDNTRAFIEGEKAYNVLLYGESGTGKSSSVKAALNEFASKGLRLIEINSNQIKELPSILENLNNRGLYFIIFMDDLSFEEFETEYKHLKAIMEGGIEAKPDNLLFYATSNRRHLVQEKWEDREGELHEKDMINERLSLTERFGLTILFNSPDQEEYLEIVKGLAKKEDIKLSEAELEERALNWQMWNNGKSGRTARQFIDSL